MPVLQDGEHNDREALKTQQPGYPLLLTQSEQHIGSSVGYAVNLPAVITLRVLEKSWEPQSFIELLIIASCPIWQGSAEH